jgi:hypothetical protein
MVTFYEDDISPFLLLSVQTSSTKFNEVLTINLIPDGWRVYKPHSTLNMYSLKSPSRYGPTETKVGYKYYQLIGLPFDTDPQIF